MLKAHLLADPKESANLISFFQSEYRGEYRGDSTHFSTQSRCCFCMGNFDFKCLLCTLTINKQFEYHISHQNYLNGSKNWNFKRACLI